MDPAPALEFRVLASRVPSSPCRLCPRAPIMAQMTTKHPPLRACTAPLLLLPYPARVRRARRRGAARSCI